MLRGVPTYQCMDLGSNSKGEIGTQVLSYNLRSGGSFGSGGRMTHTRTDEDTGNSWWAVGCPVMLPSKARHLMVFLLVLPSMGSLAAWRVPGTKLTSIIAG